MHVIGRWGSGQGGEARKKRTKRKKESGRKVDVVLREQGALQWMALLWRHAVRNV